MLRPLPVRRYLDVIKARHIEAREVLAGTAIDVSALADPAYMIEFEQYRLLLGNLTRQRDDSGLGLDVGLGVSFTDLGPLGYAAMFCRSVRHSMEMFWPRYGEMFGLMGKPVFAADELADTAIDLVTPALPAPAYRFCVEEALGQIFEIGGRIARRRPVFEKLELAYPAPAYEQRYRDLFRCPVHFNAGKTRATIGRRWLEAPLSTVDDNLSNFYQRHLQRLSYQAERQVSLASRVRDLLRRRDAHAIPTVAEIGRRLDLSERSLCRHLQHEGLSYRHLVEEFRAEQAAALLDSTDMPAKAIGDALGYRDVNAFRRAFKQWTGKTVDEHRAISALAKSAKEGTLALSGTAAFTPAL